MVLMLMQCKCKSASLTPRVLHTSGTRSHMVYKVMPACSSTPYLNMGDYKGRIGLSPPTAYPSNGEYEANKGSL